MPEARDSKAKIPILDDRGIVIAGKCPACRATPGYAHKMSCAHGEGRGLTISAVLKEHVAAGLEAQAAEHVRRSNEFSGQGSRSDDWPLHEVEDIKADTLREAAERVRKGEIG